MDWYGDAGAAQAPDAASLVARQVREERMTALLKKQKLEEEKMRTNDERFPRPPSRRQARVLRRRVLRRLGVSGDMARTVPAVGGPAPQRPRRRG
jgi:hypothetical protein